MRNRSVATLAVAGVVAVALAACGSSSDNNTPAAGGGGSSLATTAGGAGGDVGVFTWWAAGSEKTGLDALVNVGCGQEKTTFPALARVIGADDVADGGPATYGAICGAIEQVGASRVMARVQ